AGRVLEQPGRGRGVRQEQAVAVVAVVREDDRGRGQPGGLLDHGALPREGDVEDDVVALIVTEPYAHLAGPRAAGVARQCPRGPLHQRELADAAVLDAQLRLDD